MAAAVLMNPTGAGGGEIALIFLFAIPFLWFYCKLIVHRLHDLGWSGWWFLLLGPILIPLPIWMINESMDVYGRIEKSYAARQAIASYAKKPTAGFAAFGFRMIGVPDGIEQRASLASVPRIAGWEASDELRLFVFQFQRLDQPHDGRDRTALYEKDMTG